MTMNPQQRASRFREVTRQQFVPVPAQTASSFGTVLNFRLPQTGFLSKINLLMQGTIVSGAGSPTGVWATYPPRPYVGIRRLRIYTSENVEIVNISGWSLALYNMFRRRITPIATDPIAYLNTLNVAQLYTKDGNDGAAPAASTTFNYRAWWEIPISTDDRLMLGLILTQNLDVQVNMEITFANQADFGTIGGVTYTPSFTFYPEVEFFSVPESSMDFPNMDFVHTILEETIPYTANGEIVLRPYIGNVYTSLTGVIENNGAQVSPANIDSVGVRYAQTVAPYTEIYEQHVMRNKILYGFTMPDGAFRFPFEAGDGIPGHYEPRDFLNSSQQTDLQVFLNVSGLTPTNAQVRHIREQLALIG